jgi:hypothetical protein
MANFLAWFAPLLHGSLMKLHIHLRTVALLTESLQRIFTFTKSANKYKLETFFFLAASESGFTNHLRMVVKI